jgi:MFS family permease
MDTAKQDSAGWGSIFLIYLLTVLAAASISQVVPIVGDIARTFHAARQQVGWIISIPSALVAIGALLTGWLVDRVGDKPVLLAGTALIIVGDIGVTLVDTLNALLAMRVIEGVGYDLVSVSTVTLISRITAGKRRTTALTLWSSFIPMSFAIYLVSAGLLVGADRWRFAFSGHAAALAVLGLAGLTLPAAVRNASGQGTRTAGIREVLRTPACYALGISFACAAFVQTGIVSTLPEMLSRRYGMSVPAAHSVGTIGMFCNIAGCLLMGWLLNRNLPRMPLALVSVAMTLLAGCLIYLPGSAAAITVGLALAFFLGSGLIVGLWALLPAVSPTPSSRGAASGLVTQVTLWGVLFGPPAAFAAMGSGDPSRQILNVAVALVLCALMLWTVIRRAAARAEAMDGVPAAH